MLKYENVAVVGDRIRSYDFYENKECYVEGTVIRVDKECKENRFSSFIIKVEKLVFSNKETEIDSEYLVYVPMEVGFMEWDGRVEKIS